MKGKTSHNSGNNKQITAKYPNKAKEIKTFFNIHTHIYTLAKTLKTILGKL